MRAPRRMFAAPFVLTLAACGPKPLPANPPPPPDPVATDPKPQPSNGERHWLVTKADGACKAGIQCAQPGMPCNPPAPSSYECPPDLADGASLQIVQFENQADCFLQHPPVQCPPNAMCNPPRPEKVACPK